VEKYGKARQVTDDCILRHMHIACWITKATDTHSECVILPALPLQHGYASAPHCYIYAYIASHALSEYFYKYRYMLMAL